MKQISLIVLMVLAVAACNLTDKFKKGSSSSGSSTSSPGSSSGGGGEAETPQPTAAQTAALEGGESVTWNQQGITWKLPPGWKKQDVSTDSFTYGGNGGFLIVSVASMADDFPTDISINAFHEGAKVRKKNGQVDELRWLALDGLRGVQFRETKPEDGSNPQRLQWMAYRKYAGQTQYVNLMLSSNGNDFQKHLDEFYGVLYSTKIVH